MSKLHRESGLVELFSDVHVRDVGNDMREVEVAFAVDPVIEGLAAAFYMDGSGSMQNSGNYGSGEGGGRFFFLKIGKPAPNPVEIAMRNIVPYIASKDANSSCRTAYWATEKDGRGVEVIGELDATRGSTFEYDGPREFGGSTHLVPALRDFVSYVRGLVQAGEQVKATLGVFVTDGQLHDYAEVQEYTRELAKAIVAKSFPSTSLVLVGIGSDVDHEQMEELAETEVTEEYTGREIWCCAEAESVAGLPELVAHLLNENIPAFWGGATFATESGTTLASFEDMVPALVTLTIPESEESFVLTVGSDRFVQSLEGLEEDH